MAFNQQDEAIYLTRAGYKRLQRELNKLQTDDTAAVAQRIAQVRGEGDFSQEQAYFDALSDKEMLDERIARLQSFLQRATVIEGTLDPDSVTPGDRITLRDLDEKEDRVFDLVSGIEIANGRRGISLGSPVGRALLGKKVGEKFEVKVPDGVTRYKVLKIEPIPDDE
jgi:transcription elongation factor GreA